MRIRKKEWAIPELKDCSFFVWKPEAQKGKWQEEFSQNGSAPRDIHLDLGCGKCVFLAQAALNNRDASLVGIDISYDILGVGRRNIQELFGEEIPENVRLAYYNIEKLGELFSEEDNVTRLYINFCNPWPKSRGHKKRLTHTNQIAEYKKFLKPSSEIWFKTDNNDLYIATKRYFAEAGLEVFYDTQDLLADDSVENYSSEHEIKFSQQGIKIKALRCAVK